MPRHTVFLERLPQHLRGIADALETARAQGMRAALWQVAVRSLAPTRPEQQDARTGEPITLHPDNCKEVP